MTKKRFVYFLILIVGAAGIYFHTNFLVVTRHQITLSGNDKKIRIAHITDLHSKGMGWIENQMIEALKNEKPDVIVITGDLATPGGTKDGYEAVLYNLKAPQGVFFVQGNWEYWEPLPNPRGLLEINAIKDLTNQAYQLDQNLWILGFDDSEEGSPHLHKLEDIPRSAVKIGLFHSPIFFDKTAGLISLNFAGHSHGGQLRIPFFGSMWVPEGTGKYDQGWFEKNGSKMFVSRGIGTSVLPIRFNCSPELAIIDVTY